MIPGWLPVVLMGVFMAAVARQGVRAISDPDAFWHLRLGHDIIAARSVTSITGPWSTISDQPWVPTQWLTEVVLAVGEDVGGLPVVAWLFTAALLALVFLVHRLARQTADAVPAAFTTGLTVVAMAASLSPRPHVVTYLLLCITLIAWWRTEKDLLPRWWLVPLTWVWATSHGMWFVGPLVGLAVVAGLCLDRRVERRGALKLAAVPLASIAAAALTPVGPALLGAPFAVAGVGAFITEWQPPSFREPGPAAAALMVAFVVISWARSTQRIPWTRIVLLALAAGWIVLATRTVALGALIVCPLVAATLQDLMGRQHRSPTRAETWSLATVGLLVAGVSALVVPSSASSPANVPAALDGELDDLAAGSVVYNAYELGGWLRWRAPGPRTRRRRDDRGLLGGAPPGLRACAGGRGGLARPPSTAGIPRQRSSWTDLQWPQHSWNGSGGTRWPMTTATCCSCPRRRHRERHADGGRGCRHGDVSASDASSRGCGRLTSSLRSRPSRSSSGSTCSWTSDSRALRSTS